MRIVLLACMLCIFATLAWSQYPGWGEGGAKGEPPFALYWGLSQAELKGPLLKTKARIVGTEKSGGTESWMVTGLEGTGLKETVFSFESGGLTAVELNYESNSWNAAKYNELFESALGRITKKFGDGVFIKQISEGNSTVSWGYRWQKGVTEMDELRVWTRSSHGYHEAVRFRYEINASAAAKLSSGAAFTESCVAYGDECRLACRYISAARISALGTRSQKAAKVSPAIFWES